MTKEYMSIAEKWNKAYENSIGITSDMDEEAKEKRRTIARRAKKIDTIRQDGLKKEKNNEINDGWIGGI